MPLPEEYAAGQIILIDKPLKWTSFDAVNKVKSLLKHKLGLKKIKVGHAGTLDPLATWFANHLYGQNDQKHR
jgi:tRNA pseudouridine55 synthase